MPSKVSSSRLTNIFIGEFMNCLLISKIYCGRVALTITICTLVGKYLNI